MTKKEVEEVSVPIEKITDKIYMLRGQKVMLDRDLAELYEVETKQLKRAVRRNIDRFPRDLIFELTKSELENWRYQFGTSKGEKGIKIQTCGIHRKRSRNVYLVKCRAYSTN